MDKKDLKPGFYWATPLPSAACGDARVVVEVRGNWLECYVPCYEGTCYTDDFTDFAIAIDPLAKN